MIDAAYPNRQYNDGHIRYQQYTKDQLSRSYSSKVGKKPTSNKGIIPSKVIWFPLKFNQVMYPTAFNS